MSRLFPESFADSAQAGLPGAGGITVNTDTAKALNIDYSAFASMANTGVEVATAE